MLDATGTDLARTIGPVTPQQSLFARQRARAVLLDDGYARVIEPCVFP